MAVKYAAVVVLLFCSVIAVAQQSAPAKAGTVPAAQPATREDVNRLMEAMHIKKQMVEMQRTMLDQYKPIIEKMSADQLKNMTPQQRQKFQEIMAEMLSDSFKAYPPDEMIADIVPIYQKYLDKSDVAALSAFYASPTGQKFLDNQPKIVRDFMTVLMPRIQENIQSASRKMQERIRELTAEGESGPAHEHDFTPATPAPSQK